MKAKQLYDTSREGKLLGKNGFSGAKWGYGVRKTYYGHCFY